MIDLDAHRGNGFQAIFDKDPAVHIFDMFNFQVYPGMFEGDIDDYHFMIPLKNHTTGEAYLEVLITELPSFKKYDKAKLAFYNAGTDILMSDPLGKLDVSFESIIERDKYVLDLLVGHNIPTVVLTSGGYSNHSYKLIAELARSIIQAV